jgi:predicted amidohydrolase
MKNKYMSRVIVPTYAILVMILLLNVSCANNNPSASIDTSWQFESSRDEIAPDYWVDGEVMMEGKASLAMSGDGKEYVNGCWSQEFEVTPGNFYEFQTYFRQTKVDEPNRTILARIVWQGIDGEQVSRPEYPGTLLEQEDNGMNIIQQRYKVPEGAVKAKLELVYRWDADGTVYFSEASLKEVQEIETRLVNLATIHFRPRNTSSAQENLDLFGGYIKDAADNNADIVCLPEAITLVGTGKTYLDVSETIPGPSTEFLGEIARQNKINIVAGLIERSGPAIYNVAVLIDREGNLVGKYRKVCLPREEIEGGITPGNSYPVFDTEFGRIGMMICWDVQFPEVARQLAMQGAEIILLPIWGGNLTLARARAIENQVYLVSSSYGMASGVFDQKGELIVEANEQSPVVVTEVDLNQHQYWPWLGDLKNRIPREMPGKVTNARAQSH